MPSQPAAERTVTQPSQQTFKTIGMEQLLLPDGTIAWKSGKFSASEKDIIFSAMQEYVAEKGITLQELHPYYREEGDRKRFPELFQRIQALLPNRKREV